MSLLVPGTEVEFPQPNLKGKIVSAAIVANDISYLVDYKNDEGESHQRYFKADSLVEVKPATPSK